MNNDNLNPVENLENSNNGMNNSMPVNSMASQDVNMNNQMASNMVNANNMTNNMVNDMSNNVSNVNDVVNNMSSNMDTNNSLNNGSTSNMGVSSSGLDAPSAMPEGASVNVMPNMNAENNAFIHIQNEPAEPLNANPNFNPNPVPDSSNNGNIPVIPKKNKSLMGICIAGGIVILALIAFGVYYFFFKTNPTDVLKDVINDAYTDFSSDLKKIEKEKIDFDILNDSFKIDGDLALSGKTAGDLKDDKINFSVGFDYHNKKGEVSANLLENNKSLLDGNIYLKNNHYYLESPSLLTNTYDLGEYDFTENFDLSEIESYLNNNKTILSDIDYIVASFKDALLNSLNKDNLKQEKTTIKVNDKEVKVNKISYSITNENVRNLLQNITDNIGNNTELLNKISKLLDVKVDDIKDTLNNIKNSDVDLGNKEWEFNIYTKGIVNNFAGIELKNKVGLLAYYKDDKDAYGIIENKDSDEAIKLEVIAKTDKNDVTNIDVKMTEDGKEENFANVVIRKFNEDNIDLDVTINIEEKVLKATIKAETKKENDKKISGKMELSFAYDTYDLGAIFNYTLSIGDNIADIDTSKALTSYDMTVEDETKLENKINELEESNIYKFLDNLGIFAEDDYDDPYDDNDCWNDYLNSDYSGMYDEYYEAYC